MKSTLIIFVLALLMALTGLAVDMYLPAIPAIAKDLNSSVPNVQFSVSLYFTGMACGQLFGGPLSDRYGRKPIVTIGLLLFGISSLFLFNVQTIESLWFFRATQAIGGGMTTVNVSATVRDLFSGRDGAKMLSMIGSIALAGPLMAPFLGSFFLDFSSWHYIFVFLGVYGLSILLIYKILFKETSLSIGTKTTPIKDYIKILTHKKAIVFIAVQCISVSSLYIFISNASFIYQEYFDIDTKKFAMFFSFNVISIFLASQTNARLLKYFEPISLLKMGVVLQSIFGFSFLLTHQIHNVYLIFGIICAQISTMGFIFGNSTSIVLEFFPKQSASANAIIGVCQYGVGALMGFLANSFNDGTLWPIALILFLTSLTGALILWIAYVVKLKENFVKL